MECQSEISIKGNNLSFFNYKLKIKETYMGKKILVKSSKLNDHSNYNSSEIDINEEILITKTYKEGPTVDVIKKEDIINDLINKFAIYQSSVYSKGYFLASPDPNIRIESILPTLSINSSY